MDIKTLTDYHQADGKYILFRTWVNINPNSVRFFQDNTEK